MRACTYCRKILGAADSVCPDDQSPAVEVAFEALPEPLHARFHAFKPLAAGASGTLWVGTDEVTHVALVLKLLSAAQTQSAADRARIRRELRKQRGLEHPHVLRVFDEGEVDGRVWCVREYVPGETLALRLRRAGAASVTDAIAITAQLASALDALHRQGLTHRDVKPGHVVFRALGTGGEIAQLMDAGVACHEARNSASYAAPEIAAGAPASFRSDLYALGCLSYELLTGSAPFQEVAAEAVLAAPKTNNPPALANELPAPVRTLLASMLAKDPRRRPFSAQQVRRGLEPYLPAWLPAIPAPAQVVGPPDPPPSSRPPPRPDATMELSPDDLELEVLERAATQTQDRSHGPNATQELDLVDLEPMASEPGAAPVRTRTFRKFMPDRIAKALSKYSAGVAGLKEDRQTQPPPLTQVDESAPTIALQRPRAAADAQHTQEVDWLEEVVSTSASVLESGALKPVSAPAPVKPSAPPAALPKVPARRSTQLGLGMPAVTGVAQAVREASHASAPAAAAGDARVTPVPASGVRERSEKAAAAEQAPTSTTTGASQAVSAQSAQPPQSAAASADRPPADVASAANGVEATSEPPVSASAHMAAGATGAAGVSEPAPLEAGTEAEHPPLTAADSSAGAEGSELTPAAADANSSSPPDEPSEHAASDRASSRGSYRPIHDGELAEVLRASQRPPLSRRPSLLFWGAGGLLVLVAGVRLLRGPAQEHPRSSKAAAEKSALAASATAAHADAPAPSPSPTLAQPNAPEANAAPDGAGVGVAPAQPPEPTAQAKAETETENSEATGARTLSAVEATRGIVRSGTPWAVGQNRPRLRSSGPDYKSRARQLYQEGKYREAAEAYQDAATRSGTDAAAYAGLGASWLGAGDPDRAIAAYERAVQLQPRVSGFQAALGRAYLAKGDRGRALAAYSKALALDPSNQAARTGMLGLK